MDSGEGGGLRRRSPLPAIRTGRRIKDDEMRKEEEEEPMSPAARLFHEPRINCHILAIMGAGKPIDVAVFKDKISVTLVRHPRFSSVQVLDAAGGVKKARWVPAEVDLDKHIVIPDLQPEGDGGGAASADKLVEDYVASLSGSPMDHSRPLWDFHILNLPTSEAAATAVLRVHHSLGDGASLMSLLLACSRKSDDPNEPQPILHGAGPSPPPPVNCPGGHSPLRRALALLGQAWALLVLLWNTAVDVADIAATAAFLKDSKTPLKALAGAEFRPRRFVHRSVSLDDIKTIKNAMDCKVNDVLLAISSAGFSRYLSRKYGKEGKTLLGNLRMKSVVLVNMRSSPSIDAMAKMMEEGKVEEGSGWGNMFGYILLPFSLGMFKDPLDYVRRVKQMVDRKKNSLEVIFTSRFAHVIAHLFGVKAFAAMILRLFSNTTLVFSNVAGPAEENFVFCDNPLVFLAPTAYGHPYAVTVHFLSYMDGMRIVLAVDEKTIPDPHQLMDDLVAGFTLIKDSLS